MLRRLISVLVVLVPMGLWAAAPALAAGDANMASCPFETEASPGFRTYLPDCRAYELVTPPYKQGFGVQPTATAADGSRLIGFSLGTFAGLESGQSGVYEFARTSSGWIATPLQPAANDLRFGIANFVEASGDLTRSLWEGSPSPPWEASAAAMSLYLREAELGGEVRFTEIGPRDNTSGAGNGETGTSARFAGASSDLSHVLITIEAGSHLWPGDRTSSGRSLYEYQGVGNAEPRLVGVKNESPLGGGAYVNEGAELISECGTDLGAAEGRDTENAVSTSGQTIFFTAIHESCAHPEVNELYARVGGAKTVDISEPILPSGEKCSGACASAPHADGEFQGASTDGTKVFFSTSQPLIDNDKDSTTDLYEAELDGGVVSKLTLISEGETKGTAGENDANPGEGARVLGVVRVSADGSHVYFVAEGVLTKAPNSEGAVASAGGRNLYVYDTVSERTSFIGTLQSAAQEASAEAECALLASEDAEEHHACQVNLQPGVIQIWNTADARAAQVTEDGRFLAFTSLAHLTGDDTSGTLVPQLFLYDASLDKVMRASIGQAGFNEDGNTRRATEAPQLKQPSFSVAARPTATADSLEVTGEGSVLFESADALAPQAVSHRNQVYEYREGNVYLISDGQDTTLNEESESNVQLYATDASGSGIILQTADRLVPQATDTQASWYDARAQGGFPAPKNPSTCSAACQGASDYAPILETPASTSFTEGGNVPPPAGKSAPKPRSLTRAQQLAKALRACRVKRGKKRRSCEAQARGRYGAKKAARPPARGDR